MDYRYNRPTVCTDSVTVIEQKCHLPMNVHQCLILYQFCHVLVCKTSPCSHTAKCTSTQFGTQQPQHLTLNVMQAYALPGLLHVMALTGIDWTVELKINTRMNIRFQSHKKSLQQNEGQLSRLILYIYIYIYIYIYTRMCVYSFPLPLIAHELIPSAIPWNLNI